LEIIGAKSPPLPKMQSKKEESGYIARPPAGDLPVTHTSHLIGQYSATLDGEGRLQLPQGLRDEMNVRRPDFRLMANLEPDGSICLRERPEWESYVDALRQAAGASTRNRRTLLFLAANSAPVRCDKQGRVRIPDPLLECAGMNRLQKGRKDLILVGNFSDVRVWSPERWQTFGQEALADFDGGVDRLLGAPSLDELT